jgi:TatD DNase family protein
MLNDSHAHLEMLEGVPEVIQRAGEAGLEKIVAVSSDLTSSEKTVDIAENFPIVFAAVGIHPHEASTMNDQMLSKIEKLARERKKVVAIGETGLDYHYMHSPRAVQVSSFVKQIELANRLALPLVVHVRDAHDDVIKILEEMGNKLKAVIHCFTGNYETAIKYIEMGCYISFSGIITFKNAEEIREAATKIPIEKMLIETDSPYLAPVPYRGKKNEPAHVKSVAQKIAELRGISFEEIEQKTTANAKNLFRLE